MEFILKKPIDGFNSKLLRVKFGKRRFDLTT